MFIVQLFPVDTIQMMWLAILVRPPKIELMGILYIAGLHSATIMIQKSCSSKLPHWSLICGKLMCSMVRSFSWRHVIKKCEPRVYVTEGSISNRIGKDLLRSWNHNPSNKLVRWRTFTAKIDRRFSSMHLGVLLVPAILLAIIEETRFHLNTQTACHQDSQ